jgi:hypothetical protein
LDDSDTKQKDDKWQVMSAVIIKDSQFRDLEVIMGAMAEVVSIPDKIDTFVEFHACELYGGYGWFESVDQRLRFSAIKVLLNAIGEYHLPVLYGAVNLHRLNQQVYASADPLDISFRICLEGVQKYMKANAERAFSELRGRGFTDEGRMLGECITIIIVDDCDGKSKAAMQRSFRKFRLPRRGPEQCLDSSLLHDDLYFGDSRYSVGIQLADLCSYFIARHLAGDETVSEFYKLIEPHIVHGQIEPKEKEDAREAIVKLGS